MNGSVTHMLVPNPTDPNIWDTVHDIPQMEQHLITQSQKHFSQAHGTPYTIDPLTTLLQDDGLSNFGERIFHGEPIPPELLILEHT